MKKTFFPLVASEYLLKGRENGFANKTKKKKIKLSE